MGKYTYDQSGNRYQLRGSKHTCPSCGKHTLQLYVRESDGEPINDVVGKCDRHYHCGYDLKPWAYYEEHTDELPTNATRQCYKPEAPKPLFTIPADYVKQSMATAQPGQCDFIDILLRFFDKKDVEKVCRKYFLGKTKTKAVIFWQIDESGLIHEGKVMKYNTANGKRDKASWATGESGWIFSKLQGRGLLPMDASSTKIMFGQHLLATADKDTNVCVVESEKNAIFGAIAFPDFTWLAVGSAQEIGKIWKIRNILAKCRCVILVPDSDAMQEWSQKAEGFKLPNLKVWKLCLGHPDGWDIADYIQDKWMQKPVTITAYHSQKETDTHTLIESITTKNPAVALLIDRLSLEVVSTI